MCYFFTSKWTENPFGGRAPIGPGKRYGSLNNHWGIICTPVTADRHIFIFMIDAYKR